MTEKTAPDFQADDYLGVCPRCLIGCNTMRNVVRQNYITCEDCRVFWHYGENIFECWRNESKATWKANNDWLTDADQVDEFHPTPEELLTLRLQRYPEHRAAILEAYQVTIQTTMKRQATSTPYPC